MKVSTVREFRDRATALLRSKDPILLTSRGRLAGVFLPFPEGAFPIELKREIFSTLTGEIRRQVKSRGLCEEEIISDFESWQESRRATSRRR
jgi:hypothetical protein